MSVSEQFRGLPMAELIGQPLLSCAASQGKLAKITEDFITNVGMVNDGNGNLIAKMIDFKYSIPVTNADGIYEKKEVEISVPFLAIVNVPSLSIKEVNISFNMEVKTSSKESTESSASGKFQAKVNYGIFSASMSGSVSSSSKSERTSDSSAKYSVSVIAKDSGPPEGLMKVLDLLSSAIPNASELGQQSIKSSNTMTV